MLIIPVLFSCASIDKACTRPDTGSPIGVESAETHESVPVDTDSDGDSGEPGDTYNVEDLDHDRYTPGTGDCDETDAATHAGAADTGLDGVDSNCDGLDRAADRLTGVEYSGAGDADQAGQSAAFASDLDGDGYPDLLVGAPHVWSDTGHVGLAYAVHGPLVDGVHSLDDAVAYRGLSGDPGSTAGWSVVGPGDLDGDGLADMVYSHPQARGVSEYEAGVVYVIPGPATTPNDGVAPDIGIYGANSYGRLGQSMDTAGDVNGDGVLDLLIGSPKLNTDIVFGGPQPGRALVFLGPVESDTEESDALTTLIGEDPLDQVGAAVAAGDFDGDGHPDVLTGGYQSDPRGESSGAAWLVYGPVSGSLTLDAAPAHLLGEAEGDYAGHSVANAGDVDGDGADDLMVGALFQGSEGTRGGRAYLLYGPVSGSMGLEASEAIFQALGDYDWTGYALAGAGDVNLDGYGDVVVGAPQQYNASTGRVARVSLFLGPLFGAHTPDSADRIWASSSYRDCAGMAFVGARDVTGDGLTDLMVGAPYDDQAFDGAGRLYILNPAD